MLYDLLRSRRSIRKFQSKEVEKEKIDTILKSALLAPSSRSRRPWEFIAVTDKELLKKLAVTREHASAFIADAPLGIVVVANSAECDVWVEDASIASIIIQLSAQSLGLGSCWIQVRGRLHSNELKAEEYIKGVLEIPAGFSVECMIAIGYPDEEKLAYPEDGLMYNKLHFNKY